MYSADKERQPLSPPAHHHRRRRHHMRELTEKALKSLSQPRLYLIVFLLVVSFFLGYLCHNPKPSALLPLPISATSRLSSNVSAANNCKCEAAKNEPEAASEKNSKSEPTNDDAEAHNSFPEQCAKDPVAPADVRQTIFDRVFNGASPWPGFPPPHAEPLLEKEWTKGWGSTNAVFEHLLAQVRPKTIIEVGTYLGASAIHMAGLARKLGLDGVQILCVDDFRGWPGFSTEGVVFKQVNGDTMLLYQFMQNVVMANASDSIIFLPFATTTALEGLCNWGVFGDLVEIDAAHDFHSAWVDINKGYKVLRRPGGVLFGHDYAWAGVRKAVHIFARINGFNIKLDGEHWILH